ncbi:MAG: hypothetical protein RXQ94_04255 [Caldivirga sp.]
MPSVADLVRCAVHGYFRRSVNVARKYGASSVEYGLTFSQFMRCLNTRSASTVKRLVNEAVEAGLVKPVDVGVFGRRIVYRPTLRGVVYAAVDEVFFGSPKLAVLVVNEAVKWLEGSCGSVGGGGDGGVACNCLKYKLLRLVGEVLSGSEAGLRVADFNIADAVYYLLFSRIRDLLVVRYASSIVNDVGDPVGDAVENFGEWVVRRRGLLNGEEWCRAMLNVLHDWLD